MPAHNCDKLIKWMNELILDRPLKGKRKKENQFVEVHKSLVVIDRFSQFNSCAWRWSHFDLNAIIMKIRETTCIIVGFCARVTPCILHTQQRQYQWQRMKFEKYLSSIKTLDGKIIQASGWGKLTQGTQRRWRSQLTTSTSSKYKRMNAWWTMYIHTKCNSVLETY